MFHKTQPENFSTASRQHMMKLEISYQNPETKGCLISGKGGTRGSRPSSSNRKKRPEVAISFVGGTGAGKSTLLNALIGARVLPVSSMRACTAAVCEVVYRDGPYKARIEFVSRESWEKEIALIHAELRDSEELADEDRDSDEPRQMSRAVRDKLWSVYKPEGSKDPNTFDPFRLVEPQEVKFALDHGQLKSNLMTSMSFENSFPSSWIRKIDFGPSLSMFRYRESLRHCGTEPRLSTCLESTTPTKQESK